MSPLSEIAPWLGGAVIALLWAADRLTTMRGAWELNRRLSEQVTELSAEVSRLRAQITHLDRQLGLAVRAGFVANTTPPPPPPAHIHVTPPPPPTSEAS